MMDKDTIRNWKMFERARDKVQEMFYDLDGEAFMGEEIDVTFEEIEKGFKQLKEFWETKLRK
jgi:hypothetical protein